MFFQAFIPEFFLVSAILLQLICNSKIIFKDKYNFPIVIKETCSQTIFILIFLILILYNLKIEIATPWNIQYTFGSCKWIKILVAFFSILVSYIILPALVAQKQNFFEAFTILLLSIFSTFLLVGSYNLISFYLTLEMQTICFYILSGYNRKSIFATEAGLKYFIIGSFMSGCLLLGMGLIYFIFGTVDLQEISSYLAFSANHLTDNGFVAIGVGLITFVLLFKLACYPFHYWATDVYEGAPLSSSIIFSIVPKIGLVYFFIKWLLCFYTYINYINSVLVILGLSSCLVGALMSISQNKFKKLIVFSSIAQIGFIIIGLSICSEKACTALLMFLIIYLLTSVLMWGHLAVFYFFQFKQNLVSLSRKELTTIYLTSFAGLFNKNKVWSLSVLIIFFSIAGIPPLTGFLAKLVILVETVKFSYFIAICLITISAISVFYYIRVIKIIFFETNKSFRNKKNIFHSIFINNNLKKIYFIFVCILCSLVLIFFFPTNLYLFCKYIALKALFSTNFFVIKTVIL